MEVNLNTASQIVDWILKYAEKDNFKLVVGVSGGVDSALVSTLCCMTGIETHVVSIPIQQNENQLRRANNHIHWLSKKFGENVKIHTYDLSRNFEFLSGIFDYPYNSEHAFANMKSRLRMVVLYQIATSINGIVVGTGNKVEDFGIGFFTKYGDGGVDISPIGDLTKTEVRLLAKELGINNEIISAKPTDGLWADDRDDETQIGATYEELEWAMSFNEDTEKPASERHEKVFRIYKFLNTKNKHKITEIPIFKK